MLHGVERRLFGAPGSKIHALQPLASRTEVGWYVRSYEDMNTARVSSELAKELASIRRKKIQKLKAKIAAGRYTVSNAVLAKALFLAQ